jgi:hypothetical protein
MAANRGVVASVGDAWAAFAAAAGVMLGFLLPLELLLARAVHYRKHRPCLFFPGSCLGVLL